MDDARLYCPKGRGSGVSKVPDIQRCREPSSKIGFCSFKGWIPVVFLISWLRWWLLAAVDLETHSVPVPLRTAPEASSFTRKSNASANEEPLYTFLDRQIHAMSSNDRRESARVQKLCPNESNNCLSEHTCEEVRAIHSNCERQKYMRAAFLSSRENRSSWRVSNNVGRALHAPHVEEMGTRT